MATITASLDALEVAVLDLDAWRATPLPGSRLGLTALVEHGGPAWELLDDALLQIERMVRSGPPAKETLGLPLAALVQAAILRETAKVEKARAAREAALEDLAAELLGPEACAWLRAGERDGSPFWMTYRQAAALGAQVRKGEKSTTAVFYKAYGKAVRDNMTGEERLEGRRVPKSFPVFNACQIDGLPPRYHPAPIVLPPAEQNTARMAELEAFFDRIPAETRMGGNEAYYSPDQDYIQRPPPAAFRSYEHFAATKAHELGHWTGHATRLARTFGKRFGDDGYATEELVVELASAIIGAELGLPVDYLDDHASYIASWLRTLKQDSRAILSIAARADEAASYLFELAGRGPPTVDDERSGDEPATDHYARAIGLSA